MKQEKRTKKEKKKKNSEICQPPKDDMKLIASYLHTVIFDVSEAEQLFTSLTTNGGNQINNHGK